ncbi:hypothetical protein Tsubulata_019320, partial [Turnera subulata]
LLEEGGETLTFEGSTDRCPLKAVLKVHSPQFYWKVVTRADIGLAEAYIDGDFSLEDKDLGLVNLITWLVVTNAIHSRYFFPLEALRRNTLTQARRNISDHYDLSNELFATFLDETMQYSCAVFKSDDEDLKTAQMRKVSLLIEKARIDRKHEVLEIGFGWGAMAIELVKRTGCKYTGITLSIEQLKLAEKRVKDAGLEAVGHEYMEEFFRSCDSLLADDGLLVIQTSAIPDYSYDEHRRQPSFIKEYIFPGGCMPSLSRITSAMASYKSYVVSNYQVVFSRPGNTMALGNPYKGFPSAY